MNGNSKEPFSISLGYRNHFCINAQSYIEDLCNEHTPQRPDIWTSSIKNIKNIIRPKYGHCNTINRIRFNQNGCLFTGSRDGTILKWSQNINDLNSKQPVHPIYALTNHENWINDFVILNPGPTNLVRNHIQKDVVLTVSTTGDICLYEIYANTCQIAPNEHSLLNPSDILDTTTPYHKLGSNYFHDEDVPILSYFGYSGAAPPVFQPSNVKNQSSDQLTRIACSQPANFVTVRNTQPRQIVVGGLDGTVSLIDIGRIKSRGLCDGWCLGNCSICVEDVSLARMMLQRWPELKIRSSVPELELPRYIPNKGQVRSKIRELKANDGVMSLDMSLDGQKIAVGTICGTIVGWDTRSKKPSYQISAHRDVVRDLRFKHRQLFSASADCSIKIWDIRTIGKKTKVPLDYYNCHVDSVNCLATDQSENSLDSTNGHIIFSGGKDGLIFSYNDSVPANAEDSTRLAVSQNQPITALEMINNSLWFATENGSFYKCMKPGPSDQDVIVEKSTALTKYVDAHFPNEEYSVSLRNTWSVSLQCLAAPIVKSNRMLNSKQFVIEKFSNGSMALSNLLSGRILKYWNGSSDTDLEQLVEREHELDPNKSLPVTDWCDLKLPVLGFSQIKITKWDWLKGVVPATVFNCVYQIDCYNSDYANLGLIVFSVIFRGMEEDQNGDIINPVQILGEKLLCRDSLWLSIHKGSDQLSCWLDQLPYLVGDVRRFLSTLDEDILSALNNPSNVKNPKEAMAMTIDLRPLLGTTTTPLSSYIMTVGKYSTIRSLKGFLAKELARIDKVPIKENLNIVLLRQTRTDPPKDEKFPLNDNEMICNLTVHLLNSRDILRLRYFYPK